MKCMICGRGMAEGVSLFRQNAKAQPGIWACQQHRQEPVAQAVDALVAVIERADKGPQ